MEYIKSTKYPSIKALRCFDASAKFISFTKAAHALNMTQSAVSKQVSNLEETLHTSLFERSRSLQVLKLTPAGQLFLKETQKILNQIEVSVSNLLNNNNRDHHENQVLHITTDPSFCAKILIPALHGFNQRYPHIRLNIREQISSNNIDDHPVEVAFLYGDAAWPNMCCIPLFHEQCIVVAAPKHIKAPLQSIDDFQQYSLLQLRSRTLDWYRYFQLQNSVLDQAALGSCLDTFDSYIQAASLGYGLALVPQLYVQDAITEGKLIQVWPYPIRSSQAYYMFYPSSLVNNPNIALLMAWVKQYFTVGSTRKFLETSS